ncbi:unnamed protein product [Bursaphelenchus xylophilus]|uniref:(pine wood nematode) hypothetical protein n=1 Tax=Bursaphelenchus xylophilus TaxID=6326 RepID=A0A1I7SLF3_BURXY|nr:unnamed protein product [Bursaphelenchus xylophilus]CAG9129550.1 unnamed protein product [Bursaphelenchus xylophilus]
MAGAEEILHRIAMSFVHFLNILLMLLQELLYAITPYFLWPFKEPVTGKLVLLTGAVGGIGRAMAEEFAKRGANLILWDINEEQLEIFKDSLINKYNVKVYTKTIDVTNDEMVINAVKDVRNNIGLPDIVFNNAGILGLYEDKIYPMEVIDKVYKLNTRAGILIVRHFIEPFMERNSGHFVTLGSSSGFFFWPAVQPYIASKHAIVGFMSSIRNVFKAERKNVKCLTVNPHFVQTPLMGDIKYENWFLPKLYPGPVAEKVVNAIECGRAELFLPKGLFILVVLRGILPTVVMDYILEIGNFHGM